MSTEFDPDEQDAAQLLAALEKHGPRGAQKLGLITEGTERRMYAAARLKRWKEWKAQQTQLPLL